MYGYYLFALFAFFLVAVLILFARFLFSSRKKPDDLIVQEEKLLRLYRQIEDMMESFEEYVGEVQESITVQRDVIIKELNSTKSECEKILADKKAEAETPIFREFVAEPKVHVKKEVTSESIAEETKRAMKNQSREVKVDETKNEKIIRMYNDGKDENSIAKEMNMTLSEVKLIIKVNTK